MSTTYTSNLKLGKPASGDTGWGNVVNNELTDMIEQAVVGLATVNTWSTNSHTLTTADGSSSEARCAILKLTDTGTQLSGAGTVIVPAVTKLYAVINTSGQNITVKTASGSGILVKNTNQVNVICDGTNVVEQDTYSNNLVAAAMQSDSLVLASGATVTEIADEDTMSSNSATKLATQQSIKAYSDTTGSIRRSERIYPWGSGGSLSGVQPPYITVAEDATETVATFDLYGNSRTQFQELALVIGGTISSSGTHSEPPLADVAVRVQRKSAGATGTSIGAVTDADAKQGGGSSYWYLIKVAGDQTSKIDSFSFLDDGSDGASKKRIQNATYDDGTNKTTIVYDNGSSGSGLFSGTGGTVYVSSSAFESVGTWVTAVPFIPDADTESLNETFQLSERLAISSSGAALSAGKRDFVMPTLKLVPDSGGAGNIEMRVQLLAGQTSSTGQFAFNVLQVNQTNVTRP